MTHRKELVLNVVVPVLLAIGSLVGSLALPKLDVSVPQWMPLAAVTLAIFCIGWAIWAGRKVAGRNTTAGLSSPRGGSATVLGDGSQARGGDGGTLGRGGDARVVGNNSRAVGGKGGNA